MLNVIFRIYWSDEVMFDVCEACAPVPGEVEWNVIAIRYDKEKDMEQGD